MAQPTDAAPALCFDAAMRSHIGLVRPLNEDFICYVMPPDGDPGAPRGTLALVADGMGGHAAGEVASALAAEVIRRIYYQLAGGVPDVLAAAFAAANRAILEWSVDNPDCTGMGTTCTALVLRDDKAWLAHIGDSRAYLLRDETLTQLSDDQTLVAQMIRDGLLTAAQAENSPIKNVILQALGAHTDIAPVIWPEPLRLVKGDTLVLCTDGLSGLVPDPVIADIAARLAPHEACDALIEAALAAGGHDNISAGVFRALPKTKRPAPRSRRTRQLSAFDPSGGRDAAASVTGLMAVMPGGVRT
jgi:PPM family protein phosphatase